MSTTSKIEWTEATWNPTVGCTHVSPGCDNCYAARLASGRLRNQPTYAGLAEGGKFNGTVRTLDDRLVAPLHWRKPRMIFVNSMSDLFHDAIPDEFIAKVFAAMALTRRHTFQVLTKRHARMRSLLSNADFREAIAEHATDLIGHIPGPVWKLDLGGQRLAGDSGIGGGWTTVTSPAGNLWVPPWPLPNVWLGVSAENQRWADIRIPALVDTPAAVRFVSAEPLLGEIEMSRWLRPIPDCGHVNPLDGCCLHPAAPHAPECHTGVTCPLTTSWRGVDWVIAGGESGPRARPMELEWARGLRDQCTAAAVPFFFKQWGEHAPINGGPPVRVGKRFAGRRLDGRTWDEYPGGAR